MNLPAAPPLARLRNGAIADMRKLFVDLHAPIPSEAEVGRQWHKRMREANWSVSFYEAILWEVVDRKELLPDGRSWLDDVDAERFVLYGMGAGINPPDYLDASHFTLAYHKFLFAFVARFNIDQYGGLTTDELISLCVMGQHGEGALEQFPSYADRRRALGPVRVAAIEAIEEAGKKVPPMKFTAACERVHKLAIRRRAHHRVQRLTVLLEQATVDEKELWREHWGICDLLTELTGSDGKVDGW